MSIIYPEFIKFTSFINQISEQLKASNIESSIHDTGITVHGKSANEFNSSIFYLENKFYIVFGGLEEDIEDFSIASCLFLFSLSKYTKLTCTKFNKQITWTLAGINQNKQWIDLVQSGFKLNNSFFTKIGTYSNDKIIIEELIAFIKRFNLSVKISNLMLNGL